MTTRRYAPADTWLLALAVNRGLMNKDNNTTIYFMVVSINGEESGWGVKSVNSIEAYSGFVQYVRASMMLIPR